MLPGGLIGSPRFGRQEGAARFRNVVATPRNARRRVLRGSHARAVRTPSVIALLICSRTARRAPRRSPCPLLFDQRVGPLGARRMPAAGSGPGKRQQDRCLQGGYWRSSSTVRPATPGAAADSGGKPLSTRRRSCGRGIAKADGDRSQSSERRRSSASGRLPPSSARKRDPPRPGGAEPWRSNLRHAGHQARHAGRSTCAPRGGWSSRFKPLATLATRPGAVSSTTPSAPMACQA